MCRMKKKRAILKWFLPAAVIVIAACIVWIPKEQQQKSELCTVGKYKNLKITVSEPEKISMEEVENMMEILCEQTGMTRTEEMEEMVFQALTEERNYEAETEKRQAVLREILKNSTISEDVENPEETLLLAVYEQAGLMLTEEEKRQGIRKLQEVFGAASEEEMKAFLSQEEQLQIIKKEKTYEYLFKNNRFVTVPSAPQS